MLLFVRPEELPWLTVWVAAALLPLVVVVRGLSSFVNVYLLSKIGLGVLETIRLKVYRKFQDLSLSFHDRCQRGDLLSRLMQDTQFLQGGLVQIANDLIIQPLTLLGALGFLVYKASVSQQFLILLANMLLVGACVIPIRYIGKKMLVRARTVQASQGDLSSTLQENFSSQRDIRAFELEQQQTNLFKNRIRRYIQASISVVRWQSLLTPLIEFVSAVAMAATLFVANMNGMSMGTSPPWLRPCTFAMSRSKGWERSTTRRKPSKPGWSALMKCCMPRTTFPNRKTRRVRKNGRGKSNSTTSVSVIRKMPRGHAEY